MLFMPGAVAAILKTGRRGAAVRAALGGALAVPVALAGPQAGLAGTHAAGAGWVPQTTPAPAGTTAAGLGSVSCTAADACMAIGGTLTKNGEDPSFGDAWNGTAWTPQLITQPPTSDLFGVSCASAVSCMAVGRTSPQAPLAESWNGTSWSAQSVPLPGGGNSATLTGVSCTSPARCVAVGVDGPLTTPVSESWNGTTWTPHTVTLPNSMTGEFLGVSCRSYRSCTAVGTISTSTGFGPMAASWNGRSWTVQNVPSPSGVLTDAPLNAVSCPSATDCMAVGIAGTGRGGPTLAEQWNGTAWTIVSTPRLGGANASTGLESVSCPRASRCTAVGFRTVKRKTRLLAEQWTGTRWTVGAPVLPANAKTSGFGGVSCLAKVGCIAVGGYDTRSSNGIPLAERHS